jgi:(p)ppGpp synthase/HD superfamily hydrolase
MALMLARVGAPDRVIEAALLHDTVEDCEEWTVERVADEFGEDVAKIVDDLTEDKSLTWPERKQAAIDHVAHMTDDAVMVKAADKLHNLTSLANEFERADRPEDVWAKFKGGREATLRMSRGLLAVLTPRLPKALADELRAVVKRVESLA